ncbi:hypothetical protein BY996DRAFT_4573605 [Phakopsora pachyrhizi]|nr:hypothetical protein BY996DRAFT_4573605 [Phakopsora pachyrhizi]
MDSMDPRCTPLKKTYDACFNQWFERYLKLSTTNDFRIGSDQSSSSMTNRQDQVKILNQSYGQYEKECGKDWEVYKTCLDATIRIRQLKPLLDASRRDDPLNETIRLESETRKPHQ